MKCTWEDISTPDANNWRRVRCKRCKGEASSPYPHQKIRGVCFAWPFPGEWGYMAELLLAACCIRKRGYLWLKTLLGLSPKCGCDKRAEALNALGSSLAPPRE